MRARLQHNALRKLSASDAGQQGTWKSLGPAQVATSAFGLVTGRVTSIAADSSDRTGNTIYVGTTGGGVWKSTNAAGSPSSVQFVPVTDSIPGESF